MRVPLSSSGTVVVGRGSRAVVAGIRRVPRGPQRRGAKAGGRNQLIPAVSGQLAFRPRSDQCSPPSRAGRACCGCLVIVVVCESDSQYPVSAWWCPVGRGNLLLPGGSVHSVVQGCQPAALVWEPCGPVCPSVHWEPWVPSGTDGVWPVRTFASTCAPFCSPP